LENLRPLKSGFMQRYRVIVNTSMYSNTYRVKAPSCLDESVKGGVMKRSLVVMLLAIGLFTVGSAITPEITVGADSTYKVGSGDVLEIVTWKEEDLSKEEIIVRNDGKISFPLLNDIQAGGRTPMEIKTDIERKLRRFVDNPAVTVMVRSLGSQKFYILGEVINTGEYDLVKNLTVMQAFAIAGGFTEWASKSKIILLRIEDGQEKIYTVDYKDVIKGKNFKQNIKLKANDTIIVP